MLWFRDAVNHVRVLVSVRGAKWLEGRGVVGQSYLGKGCLMTPPEVSLFCSCWAKSIRFSLSCIHTNSIWNISTIDSCLLLKLQAHRLGC